MQSLHPRYPVLKVPAPARLAAAVAQGLMMPETGAPMRGPQSTRYQPRFPAVVPVRGEGRSRVTHPFATLFAAEAALTVRLACVRHAASVHPEPGSNSSFGRP